MAGQHTPGRWRVDGPAREGLNPNMGLWSVEGVANVANDCSWFDAHLIAAAPDLLEACKALDAALCDGFDTQAGRVAARRALIAARAAIAKAEGRS